MAKSRKIKKGLADKVQNKKKHVEKKVNPFEIKFNKSKQIVLGKRQTKYDKGMPGLSRSKAIKKRESTLLVEYKKRGKANTVLDKRIGENDASMPLEDKMLARYAAEKKKIHGKSIFNLNDDDDELTHYGQSLAEIENFEDKIDISDEEDDEATAKLMQAEQFGGFMRKQDDDQAQKTWKERMDEIISQSKKAKHERQTERGKNQELTDDLDQQWKQLQSLVVSSGKEAKLAADAAKSVKDDYDITVGELKFEATGKPSDRLKSEEEIAREERERLEKLEADRLRRMKGHAEEDEIAHSRRETTHRSADDLDDDFDYSTKRDLKSQELLNYKDGKLVQGDDEESPDGGKEGGESEREEDDDDDDDVSEAGSDEEMNGGESDEDGNKLVQVEKKSLKLASKSNQNKGSDIKASKKGKKAKTSGKDDDSEDDDDGDDNDDDDDVNDDDDDDEGDDIIEIVQGDEVEGETEEESEEDDDSYSDLEMNSDEDEDADKTDDREKREFIEKLIKRKQIMEAARTEIPFTFRAPDTYDDFEKLLNEYDESDRTVVVERLRKCTHISLSQGNADKLKKILTFLFDYIMDLCAEEKPPPGSLLDAILVHFHQMTQKFPLDAARKMVTEIQLRHEEYKEICGDKAWKGLFPGLDTLVLLKMVGSVFPTSDFTHRVATPAMMFIAHVLNQSPIRCETDIVVGLFLCNIFLEYQSFSKRIMPEVLNFLHSVLFTALEQSQQKDVKRFPPNIGHGDHDNLLLLKIKSMKSNLGRLKLSETIRTEENTLANDDFRLRAVKLCLSLVDNFADLYEETAAFSILFKPLSDMIKSLPIEKFPKELKTLQASVLEKLVRPPTLTHLTKEKNKPKSLKLLEPKFDEVFKDRKKRSGNREQKERQTLLHKLKKEKKGALREIRKDTQFLSRVKLKETMERDAERKRKVKEIHGFLANQEGEFKALKRKRKF